MEQTTTADPRSPEQATSARIRTIAAEQFAARGFGATSMRDIATAGGVTAGAIYNHFPSKEAILNDIALGFHGQLLQRLRAETRRSSSHGEPATTRLDRLVRVFGRMVVEDPAVCRTAERELAHLEPQHRTRVHRLRSSILDLFEAALTESAEAGDRELPAAEAATPRRIVTSIANMLTGLSEATPAELASPDSLVETHVQLVRGMLHR